MEGTVRYLVKDRMDITGARWGLEGAKAVLKLHALRTNGDIEEYWGFHLLREKRRIHQSRYQRNSIPSNDRPSAPVNPGETGGDDQLASIFH